MILAHTIVVVVGTAILIATPFIWWRAIKAIRQEWKSQR